MTGAPAADGGFELILAESSAVVSPCERYRYVLRRVFGSGPAVMFVGLNPSTADEHRDDPTIRRCIGFAKRWGYGTVVVTNLYAWRATQPRDLRQAACAVGEPAGESNVNDRYLAESAAAVGLVVVASRLR